MSEPLTLKPCPFCALTPTIMGEEGVYTWGGEHYDWCPMAANSYDTEAEAIAAWNRRANELTDAEQDDLWRGDNYRMMLGRIVHRHRRSGNVAELLDQATELMGRLSRPRDMLRRATPGEASLGGLAAPREQERSPDPLWMIWSYEHHAWWRANRSGYSPLPILAGRYSTSEAAEIVRTRGVPETEIAVMAHQAERWQAFTECSKFDAAATFYPHTNASSGSPLVSVPRPESAQPPKDAR